MNATVRVRRALISVSDKTGLADFARALDELGVEIVSTGGTARAIEAVGLPVRSVESLTGFPEMLDGRVKTLHPIVHGGILGRRGVPEHEEAMRRHGIGAIDLVCVNLYPFERTVADPAARDEDAIENIDIGGPALIRSAAKNHESVAVVTDPAQYDELIAELRRSGGSTSRELRRRLAAAAFERTARYDGAIAEYLTRREGQPIALPGTLARVATIVRGLRHGENPHQPAALYRLTTNGPDEGTILGARQLHGKELSYNNINDAAAALEIVRALTRADPRSAAACVVKHMNPCGAALATTALDAAVQAIAGDPLAAYGGIMALSAAVDAAAAGRLCERDVFLEVLVAPGITDEALAMLRDRWANLRILTTGPLGPAAEEFEWRSIPGGGLLVQRRDDRVLRAEDLTHRAGPAPTPEVLAVARAMEIVGRALTSNAVCIGGPSPEGPGVRLFGAGAGQMDRLTASRIACEKAGRLAAGALAYSDAFFPFPDGPRILIDAGVTTIVHPGGAKRDQETFDLCTQRGVTCLTTGVRHFRH